MANEQLYLAIGLPIVFNLIFNGVLFLALNSRVAALETRIGGVETRIDGRLNTLEGRLAALEQSNAQKFDLLIGSIHDFNTRLSRLEERLEHR